MKQKVKRKLSLRKRKYETGLLKLIELFNIDDKEYKKDFDYLSEKMIELGIKYNSILNIAINFICNNNFSKIYESCF